MSWKTAGLVVAGLAAGVAAAKLVHGRADSPAIVAQKLPAVSAAESTAVLDTTSSAEIDPRIQELKDEIAALRAADIEKIQKSSREKVQGVFYQMKQADSDSLAAAGFTQQRVDWLKSRANELLADLKRAEEDSKDSSGVVDRKRSAAYLAAYSDKDILLLPEISEAEFERYRTARGQPTGVEVEAVPAGSNAERAGIKPGDEILSYGGKRVISIVSLNIVAGDSPPAGTVPVELRREGKKIRVSVPSGPIYIKARDRMAPL